MSIKVFLFVISKYDKLSYLEITMSLLKIKISDDITTNDSSTAASTKAVNELSKKMSLPIGFEYFQTNPNVRAGHLPLVGGLWSRELYADLWAWVQTQDGYLISESEWQSKSSTNDGAVPFYSTGDGSTTFRVPALTVWCKGKKGDEAVGSYLGDTFKSHSHNVSVSSTGSHTHTRGSMNITGGANLHGSEKASIFNGISGAFYSDRIASSTYRTVVDLTEKSYEGGSQGSILLDASRSWTGETSPNGNHTHTVTISENGGSETKPKTIIGIYCVVALGSISSIGNAQAENILSQVEVVSSNIVSVEGKIKTLESNINTKVSKSGDTMTGRLLIRSTDYGKMELIDNNLSISENPAEEHDIQLWFSDKNRKGLGVLQYIKYSDGRTAFLNTHKTNEGDSWKSYGQILETDGSVLFTTSATKFRFGNGTQFWIA